MILIQTKKQNKTQVIADAKHMVIKHVSSRIFVFLPLKKVYTCFISHKNVKIDDEI